MNVPKVLNEKSGKEKCDALLKLEKVRGKSMFIFWR